MSGTAVKIALAVSLTVNVFAVGAVVGAGLIRHRMIEQRQRPPMGGNPMMRVADQLPPDVRTRYVAAMRKQGETDRPQMMAARAARVEAAQSLSATPYDPAVTSAALERARTAEAAIRASLENAVVDFSKDLKPEERSIIAKALRGNGGPGGRRGGGRGDRGFGGQGGRDGMSPQGFGQPMGPAPESAPAAPKP